jgi:hypothetical protein
MMTMRSLRSSIALAALAVTAGLAAGCGTSGPPGAARSPGTPASAPASPSARATATAPAAPATTPASRPATAHPGTAHRGTAGRLNGVTVGQHATFDRITFQFSGGIPSYRVGYVTGVVSDPKGTPLPLPGQAFLRVVFHPASGYRSYTGPAVLTPMFPALLQVRNAGDFEGYLSFGAGASQRASVHTFALTHPFRVVVDIGHTALQPFPGIWDITSWPQFWQMQAAWLEGHQPWLADPPSVVQAWAAGNMTKPVVRQTGRDTFTVTEPGTGKQATVSGTRPVTVGAQLWVITKITYGSGT